MAAAPNSNEVASQGLRSMSMVNLTILKIVDSAQSFTVPTSLLIQSSKWFEETLNSVKQTTAGPSIVEIPSRHSPAALGIFVDYLYQRNIKPHTTAFTNYAVEVYHLSRFIRSADFERCCQTAIEHALSKGTLKPSLRDLQGLLEYDTSNLVRTQVFNNIVDRISKKEYMPNVPDEIIHPSTWLQVGAGVAEKERNSKQGAAVNEPSNKDDHNNVTKNYSPKTVTTGESSGLPQSQASAAIFGSQTQPFFGKVPPNNVKSHSETGASPFAGPCGTTSHNIPSTSGGLFGAGQAQLNNSGGLFGNLNQNQPQSSVGLFGCPRPNAITGGFFGNPSHNQSQSSGGLFGNAQSNTATGGLFGHAQTQPSSGLFGHAQANIVTGGIFGRPQPSSGGLFGNPRPNVTSEGLFGKSNPTQPQSSGSLFGNPQPKVTTGGLFGHPQPHSSGSLFGHAPNSTTNTEGLFGSRPAQQETTTGILGGKPADVTSGGLFGRNSQSQPQTSSCFCAPHPTNNANPDDSKSGGLFAQNQAQNRSSDAFDSCKPSVNVFGQTNPPSTFRSSLNAGVFNLPTTTWADTYKPTPAQETSIISPLTGYSQSTESGFETGLGVHKMGTVATPYIRSREDLNGQTFVYNHIGFMEPYSKLSTEELRLNDYNNGFNFGPFRPLGIQTEIQTGFSQNNLESLPRQVCIPLSKLNPAAEIDQLSRQVASQKTELEALRIRLNESEKFNSKANDGGPFAKSTIEALKMIPWGDGADNCLTGLNFVITGELQSLSRCDAHRLVEQYGAKTSLMPSRKTDFVVLGDSVDPRKLDIIQILGIKTIDEDQLFHLIRCRPKNGGQKEIPKTETSPEEKYTIEGMATMISTLERRLNRVEEENQRLKTRQEEYETMLIPRSHAISNYDETLKRRNEAFEVTFAMKPPTISDFIKNDNEQDNVNEANSITSTPVNILTPSSSTTSSPSPTSKHMGASTTNNADEFITINLPSSTSPATPTQTSYLLSLPSTSASIPISNPTPTAGIPKIPNHSPDHSSEISPVASIVLAYVKEIHAPSPFTFKKDIHEISTKIFLPVDTVETAFAELTRKGVLHYNTFRDVYRCGEE